MGYRRVRDGEVGDGVDESISDGSMARDGNRPWNFVVAVAIAVVSSWCACMFLLRINRSVR